MPRKPLTSRLDIVGHLDLKPEEVVDEFRASKNTNGTFMKPPNCDSPGDSVHIALLHVRREHKAMMVMKDEWQKNLQRKNETYENKIRNLSKTQAYLRKKFADVNAFMKDCEDKQRDSEKRIQDEQEKHTLYEKNIAVGRNEVKKMTRLANVLSDEINAYKKYELVLEDVVKQSETFSTIKDLVERCDGLMLTQVDISNYDKAKLEEIEQMRKVMIDITKEAALKVLGLKNELNELERAYSVARSEALKWEKQLAEGKDIISDMDLQRNQTEDGIDNLYKLLCKRREIPAKFQRVEIEEQTDFIINEFEIMRETLNRLKAKKEAKTQNDTLNIC